MLSIVWGGDAPIAQPFGPTTLAVEPLLNGGHIHTGIDIGMSVWTRLNAARAGRVAYIGYGLLAIETGAQVDWYVHIESAQVALNAQVARGDFVAYSGEKVPSGGSLTGPHLHFEVQNSPEARLSSYDANGRLIVPGGALNNPATAIDPVPVLEGVFGAIHGGGDVIPTQAEFNALVAGSPLANILGTATSTYQAVLASQKAVLASQSAVLAAVQGIPGAGALNPAQAQQLQETHDAAQQAHDDAHKAIAALEAVFKAAP